MAELRQTVLIEEDREVTPCPACGDPIVWHIVVDLNLEADLKGGSNGHRVDVDLKADPHIVAVSIDHVCGLLAQLQTRPRVRVCMCDHNDRLHVEQTGPCLSGPCDCRGFIERNT